MESVLSAGRRTGAVRALGRLYGRHRLTVLAYHRVAPFDDPDFDTDRRNVSADREALAQQMAYVADRFSPIGLDRLVAWLDGDAGLPERPVPVSAA